MNKLFGTAKFAFTLFKCETCQNQIPQHAKFYIIGARKICQVCGARMIQAELEKIERFTKNDQLFDFQIWSQATGKTLMTEPEPKLLDFG